MWLLVINWYIQVALLVAKRRKTKNLRKLRKYQENFQTW